MQDLMTPSKRFDHLTNEIEAAYHEAVLKFGFSDTALVILYTICNFGDDCLLSEINKLSGISRQTINSALRRLEADEIVFLETYDGKKKKVCLTDKGKKVAAGTALQLIRIENEIFASWTQEEQDLYLELTQRYLEAFREKIKGL